MTPKKHRFIWKILAIALLVGGGLQQQAWASAMPEIKSETQLPAADGKTKDDRLDIGITEKVNLSLDPAAPAGTNIEWSIDSGGTLSAATGATTVLTAGNTAVAAATVTCKIGGVPKTKIFKIHVPEGVRGVKGKIDNIHANRQGARMRVNVVILPDGVSFQDIWIREKADQTDEGEVFTGVFATNKVHHTPGPAGKLTASNSLNGTDHVGIVAPAGAFYAGTITYNIP